MPAEARRRISEPGAMEALAHPVRLELMDYLMSQGPATASACARAVGDTPSNCSYHLRVLAKLGLVGEVVSKDGRERPWEALITGFDIGSAHPKAMTTPEEARLEAVTLQLDQRRAREYLARRDREPSRWRRAAFYSAYTLRLTPKELSELERNLDALIRPYIAATRADRPRGSALVHLGTQAFRAKER
jgi:DNA-binding transcriptional ArsR family regulator